MVAVKERLNPLADRTTRDMKMVKTGQVKTFKVYAEVGKENVCNTLKSGTKGKSGPHDSSSHLSNGGDSKNGMKNLEKRKSKQGELVKPNTGRKVLADIGNVKDSFSRTTQRKISVTWKGKSEKISYPQRDSVDLRNTEASSSDKPSRGRVGLEQIKAAEGNQIAKKTFNKNFKATSEETRTKLQARNSLAASATNRKPIKNPLHLTRKSLPVPKQASQPEISGTRKGSSQESEKLRGKCGFPVKPSVRRITIPKPSTLGNRVSGGFVVMSSRSQTKVDAGVLSRKSIKPSVKTTNKPVNTQRKSRSNQDFAITKKQEKDSLSNDIPSIVSHKESAAQDNVSGDATSDITARRKSDRRNSFTCSLISRSKECSKVPPRESLPSIYDDRNPLEVGDYVDDIYQYYWVMEAQNPLLINYMESQNEITSRMRGILINWLIEVHQKFDLMEETLFLSITLLDRYLSLEKIRKNEMQLVGLTALLLASKYEDFWHPRVSDLITICSEPYTKDQMLNVETAILKKLKFRLNEPTLYVFMLRFLKAAQSDMKFEHLAFYLIELCLVEHEALRYKPSMLCASAIYVARCTLRLTPPWTPLLAKHARYEESQIRDCAEMILKFHKAAKTTSLKVTHEKYTRSNRSKVANIKPLDGLPV